MIKVTPISVPIIDWERLFVSMDRKTVAKLPATWGKDHTLSLPQALKYLSDVGEWALEFVDIIFLVDAEIDIRLIRLKWAKIGRVYLLKGNLLEWRDAILSQQSDANRLPFNMIFLHFEKAGCWELFTNYKKKILEDGTFILEDK